MAWVDLGNDTKLATVILKRIENKIAKMQSGAGHPKAEGKSL
jgi:hypothetical protein